jgi:replicative superfamily II helicase
VVDFRKRLKQSAIAKVIEPLALYETLDRASDKGPLRPAQAHVLTHWHTSLRDKRDLIVKLHTGQGKTLIGLLMLQSRLNEGKGPALYLSPNNFLVDQTCQQAKQFGIATVQTSDELPSEFLDGKAIFVTTVHKLFNGRTRFGLGPASLNAGTLILDDCHACVDAIKQATTITIKSSEQAYKELVSLFESDLLHQGAGTFSDLRNGEYDALLPIPYWAWHDQREAATEILPRHHKTDSIKFAWPLLKDALDCCQCIVSGTSLEIIPYAPPLHCFGSYANATHRVFMSATVTDDSFLIKGLGLAEETILQPLAYPKEKWCGEKMILMPSMIDPSLTRDNLLPIFASPSERRTVGVVALCPSFKTAEDWSKAGSEVATSENIYQQVQVLKDGNVEKTLVIANRYDGVDLPDDSCRVLIIDSLPSATSLYERHVEAVRPTSDSMAQRTARMIEQGLGRSVRGEKDYCAIVLLGSDLVQAVRSPECRKFYSAQTRKQIAIGDEVATFAKEDIEDGIDPNAALDGLIKKSLERDAAWKEFYVERMETLGNEKLDKKLLAIYTVELEAERFAEAGRHDKAAEVIQSLLDGDEAPKERGWYVQELARHTYHFSKVDSAAQQVAAHKENAYLLKPKDGMVVKLLTVSQKRVNALIEWVKKSSEYNGLIVRVDSVLTDIRFGVDAERFERAFDELGRMLGFATDRPDKAWKEGPDNLWCLKEQSYLLVECKSRISTEREAIHKSDSGQMNNACAWFDQMYKGASAARIIVHPAKKCDKGAAFNADVRAMRPRELRALTKAVREFFMEFAAADLSDLDVADIQKWLEKHALRVSDLQNAYSVAIA